MKIYPVFLKNNGCPNRCLFCDQEKSVAGEDDISPSAVSESLDRRLPERGDGEIAFYGGSFTMLPTVLQREYLEVAKSFIARKRVAGIRLSTRPDALEDPCLRFLTEARVSTIEVGCQSFDDSVLSATRRGHRAMASAKAVRRCRLFGFNVGVQLMPGLPAADAGEAQQSLDAALRLCPDFLRIYPAVVVEGTGLARLWRNGAYRPMTLDEAVEICADMLLTCRRAGVPVIRLGLQQDQSLNENLLAGPHHPAFGQLVRSRLWRKALTALPATVDKVRVCPLELGDAIGHRRQNSEWLQTSRPGLVLESDPALRPGELSAAGQRWTLDDIAHQVNYHEH